MQRHLRQAALDAPAISAARDTGVRSATGMDWAEAIGNAVVSGSLAAVATSLGVALAGAREGDSAVGPINATSHIAWGDAAGAVERVDAKHTLLGAALNLGACVFWATFYEKAFGRAADRGDVPVSLLGGAAVATAAYVTDYHVVPQRLTPGWELRLSGRAVGAAYVLLALALPLRGLLRRRR